MVLVFLLSGLGACSEQDQHSQYVGFYKFKSPWTGKDGIMEIVKEKNSFLMHDGSGKVIPLEITNDGLKAKENLMALSSDGNILRFAGQELPRLTEEDARELILEQDRAKKICDDLNAETAVKSKEIKDKNKWNQYVTELAARKPEGCRVSNSGMRW